MFLLPTAHLVINITKILFALTSFNFQVKGGLGCVLFRAVTLWENTQLSPSLTQKPCTVTHRKLKEKFPWSSCSKNFIATIFSTIFPMYLHDPCTIPDWVRRGCRCWCDDRLIFPHYFSFCFCFLFSGEFRWPVSKGGCWCGTCSESVFHHQLTLDICNEILTFVSVGTFLLSSSASLAVKLIFALLVENAVIVFLLKGKPLAVLYLIALFNAFLKGGDGKWVYKVSLALECAVTFSCRTSRCKKKANSRDELNWKVTSDLLKSKLRLTYKPAEFS